MRKKGLYVYGIIPASYDASQFRELEKLGVNSISHDKIAAITSEDYIRDYNKMDTKSVGRSLVEHQKKMEAIMELGFSTIIPMQLGTFVYNHGEVQRILEKGYNLIIDIIGKISGLVEVDIVSTWADFNKVLSEISADPQVVEMKNKIQKNKNITQSDQLSVGYLVKKLLDKKNETCASYIIKAIKPFCQDFRQYDVQNDQMVSNTAFLINRTKLSKLKQALDTLDEEFQGKLNFKYVGPMPCYNFYTLEVKKLNFEDIIEAKNELGLNDSTSKKNIRQAYLKKAKQFHPDVVNKSDSDQTTFNRIKKNYQTMLDFAHSVNPSSGDELFSLQRNQPKSISKNPLLIKIKKGLK